MVSVLLIFHLLRSNYICIGFAARSNDFNNLFHLIPFHITYSLLFDNCTTTNSLFVYWKRVHIYTLQNMNRRNTRGCITSENFWPIRIGDIKSVRGASKNEGRRCVISMRWMTNGEGFLWFNSVLNWRC